jgi:hypothetical protein
MGGNPEITMTHVVFLFERKTRPGVPELHQLDSESNFFGYQETDRTDVCLESDPAVGV